jgi:hypothetical protein
VPWYYRVRNAINVAAPFLVPTQTANLALLVSAILKKRTLCLSELARAYPTPKERRVASPKHDLLHRIKRLWRFTDNERVDPLVVQLALVPHTIARLGFPRLLGLAIDWTFFDTTLPSGQRMRYQVLRIAVPRKGRALPLLQSAYDRDDLSPNKSQNRIEQDALLAVVGALPMGVRPVVLADRGFHRASFIAWLARHRLHYVVRIRKGTCVTEASGHRWKLGEEGLELGELRFVAGVRYGLHHDRPRELLVNVVLCWRVSKSRARNPRREQPDEPWYLATSLKDAKSAASWYWPEGLDRAVLQGCQEPLRVSAGTSRLSQAPFALANGAEPCPLVADADGVTRGWCRARGLPLGGRRLGAGKRDQYGAHAVRETRGYPATLLTPANDRWVGGYASDRNVRR